MTTIILAAGYAVRLQPLTLDMPKSLLTIGGKTILDRLVDKLTTPVAGGRIVIVSNGKFFGKFNAWAASFSEKKRITVINDGSTANENRLGAIRDLTLAIEKGAVDDDTLVLAGDNIFDLDLKDFLAFAAPKKDAVSIAVHDIGDKALASSFGVVAVDKAGKVTDFEEKPARPKSTLISTGIYYFPKNKLSIIKEYVTMQNKLDAPGHYIGWLAAQGMVCGFSFLEKWYDIGNIESYRKADAEYTEKEKNHGKA